MNDERLEKDIALMKLFEQMKSMLDPYETLAKLSKDYEQSKEYTLVNNVLSSLNKNEKSCLINVIDSIIDHLNNIILMRDMSNNDPDRPKMVYFCNKGKNNFMIKAATVQLTEFYDDIGPGKVKEMINSIPQYEKRINKIYDQINENKEKFDKTIEEVCNKALKHFNLPGFTATHIIWDEYHRSCCKYIIRYYNDMVNQVGRDFSYSLNLANEDNCKKQLADMDRKIFIGFEQNIIPQLGERGEII